ncbi:MAG: hypothetical protein R3C68_10720 [Myxococcota bacterium]
MDSPNGFPTAITQSPIWIESESPKEFYTAAVSRSSLVLDQRHVVFWGCANDLGSDSAVRPHPQPQM